MADTTKTSPAEHTAEVLKEKATKAVDSAQEKYGAVVDEVSVRAMEATDAVREYANQAADALEESVRVRPMTTVLGAVAVGFVIGAIWES